MGYTGAVGARMLDKIATMNVLLDGQMDAINTALVAVEEDVRRGHRWSQEFTQVVREVEVDVRGLMAGAAFMRGERDRMRREMDGLLNSTLGCTR